MAVANELVERAHRLLDRCGRVEAVDLVQVDVIELQALQACLHPVEDVAARRAAHVRAGAGFAEDLGGHHHLVARHLQVAQRLAGDLLGHATRVHVGGVDEVHARVQRLAHELLSFRLLQLADLAPHAGAAAEGHGAEAKFGNEKAGAAERAMAHVATPVL